MYDQVFTLVVWSIAVVLTVAAGHIIHLIQKEIGRLRKLESLTKTSYTKHIDEAKHAGSAYLLIFVLLLGYVLWNAREALRVLFV